MREDDENRNVLSFYLVRFAVLAVAFVFLAVFFYFLTTALEILTSAEPGIVTAIMGAFGVVTVALVANIWSKQLENSQQARRERRTRKAEVYEEFLTFWLDGLAEEGSAFELKKDLKDHVSDPTPRITTWGSEAVFEENVAFKNTIGKDRDTALIHFEKVLLAIREDLGYSDSGLAQSNLLQVFLHTQSADKPYKGETGPER
jgi:hypothetical protein